MKNNSVVEKIKEICECNLKLKLSLNDIFLLNLINTKEKNNCKLICNYIKLDLLYKRILVESYYHNVGNESFLLLREHFIMLKDKLLSTVNNNYKKIINFYLSVSIFNYNELEANPYLKENNRPKVSVLLPTYNSENYIIDSVCSIINQTFKDFELIIINECATTDNTLRYLGIFKDKRIKIINTTRKMGLASSLNLGIKNAKGKYIARIDADDISLSNRLEEQYNYMENNSNIDVCASWQKHFGINYIWTHKSPLEDEKIKALLLFECCICHSTVMIKKQSLLDNNYLYNYNIRQEDYDLWCRMSVNCNFAILQKVLGYYRIQEQSITKKDFKDVCDSQISIVLRNLKKLHINKCNKELLIGLDYVYNKKPYLKKEAYILLDKIIENNKKYLVYDENALNEAIQKRKNWINNEYYNFCDSDAIETISFFIKIKRRIYKLYNKFKCFWYNNKRS